MGDPEVELEYRVNLHLFRTHGFCRLNSEHSPSRTEGRETTPAMN